MRCSLAAMDSNEVGERRGKERTFRTGSFPLDGVVGVWKVSPFLSGMLDLVSAESVARDGRASVLTGRRRGCTRVGLTSGADMMG